MRQKYPTKQNKTKISMKIPLSLFFVVQMLLYMGLDLSAVDI